MHILANGAVRNLRSTIMNHLKNRIMKKIYTIYQTNEINLLGGYMTYATLSDAFDALNPNRGVNTITAITCADSEWWNNGRNTACLTEMLSRGVIYRA